MADTGGGRPEGCSGWKWFRWQYQKQKYRTKSLTTGRISDGQRPKKNKKTISHEV